MFSYRDAQIPEGTLRLGNVDAARTALGVSWSADFQASPKRMLQRTRAFAGAFA